MLSVGGLDEGSNQAIEVFHAQDALFAENAGQWGNVELPGLPAPSPSGAALGPLARPAPVREVYFGYNKGGTRIFFTEESIEFGLSRRELKEGVDAAAVEEWDRGLPGRDEDLYETTSTHFSLNFDGARATIPTGADRAETVFNYHLGPKEDWVEEVATYKRVVYAGLYDGIDLHTFSRHGQMKYEFHVAPGADWSTIQLSYDGIEGLSLGEDGSLSIQTKLGTLVDEGLYIYQVIDGEQVEVAGEFTLIGPTTYTFTITGDYDPSAELIIDPEVEWGSYLGGSNYDYAYGVATDASGNVYVAGRTSSSGWVSGGWDTSLGGSNDGFVVSLTPSGAHRWSSYLGGSDSDYARAVATDGGGNVYVAGYTDSDGWVSRGWDTLHGGWYDGFVAKLSPSGSHLWSSYLGGSDNDYARAVATDGGGNVYVAGDTCSNGWGSDDWSALHGGSQGGFVVKIVESTHLPGDLNGDGYVGSGDLDIVRANWGQSVTAGDLTMGDASGDGLVGSADLDIVRANWGAGTPPAATTGGAASDEKLAEIPIGGEVTGRFAGIGDMHVYQVHVGANEHLAILLDGHTYGANELYVRYGTVPTVEAYDYAGVVSGMMDQQVDIPVTEAGTYYVLVYAAGLDLPRDFTVSADVTSTLDTIPIGGEVTGRFAGIGDMHVYQVHVGANEHLAILLDGHTYGANELYVRYGTVPTVEAYDYAGVVSGMMDQQVDIPVTEAGTYYVLVYAAGLDLPRDFTVSASVGSTHLSGDLDGDAHVGSGDLDIVRANWGSTVEPGDLFAGDPSGDGIVGSADLDIVRANWGTGTPPAAANAAPPNSAPTSTPTLVGPRRAPASDAAFSSWRDSNSKPGLSPSLSDADLASLAQAAWLRELEGLRGKERRNAIERGTLSEMVLMVEFH